MSATDLRATAERMRVTTASALTHGIAKMLDQHADIHDTYDCLHDPCAHVEFVKLWRAES